MGRNPYLWDNMLIVRPPIGPETMTNNVKFRLTDAELDDLTALSAGGNVSETLRRLIREEKKRRTRRGH